MIITGSNLQIRDTQDVVRDILDGLRGLPIDDPDIRKPLSETE